MSNITKLAIKTTKNPTFIKSPSEVFGNKETLTFKWLSPNIKSESRAKIKITMRSVNVAGGSTLWAGADVSIMFSVL